MADTAFTEITTGLQFPEGPVAMPDGSVILTEMFASRLTRVAPDGTKTTVAEINGAPNGLAVGPDGALYLCNNGHAFTALNAGGLLTQARLMNPNTSADEFSELILQQE